MKTWWIVVLVLPGGCVIAAALWLRRRWIARASAQADALIRKPRPIFATSDDSVRLRTRERRKAADGIRKRAAKVETGASVSDVLRAVK